ncbi:MAG: cytochrome c oxidase assembly factor Coa1 family protein [Planctomycetia bacterium]
MRRIVMPGLVALAVLVGSSGCGRLANHPVVVDAKAEIERNPRVLSLLAGPGGQVACSPKVTGRANETDGIAAMEFEAGGPKGRGTVIVEGKKLGPQWSVTRLELRPLGGGEPLSLTADLVARTGTDTPKFDPTAATTPSATAAPPPPAEIEIALPPGGPPP